MHKRDFMIVIAEYMPEYSDGRIARIKSLEAYLASMGQTYCVVSRGRPGGRLGVDIKYGWTHYIRQLGARASSQHAAVPSSNTSKTSAFWKGFVKCLYYRIVLVDAEIVNIFHLWYRVFLEVRNRNPRVLLVSAPKFSVMIPVIFMRWSNRRIVFDLRDLPFTHSLLAPNAVSKAIIRWVLLRAKAKGAQFWVTTSAAAIQLNEIFDTPANTKVVTNGFDVYRRRSDGESVKKFDLGYFGNLGGARTLSISVETIAEHYPVFGFWGGVDQHQFPELVPFYHGSLKGEDLINAMHDCSCFLVIINENEDAKCAVPGKLYEYMSFGTPILYLGPDESASLDLLRRIGYPHYRIMCGVLYSYNVDNSDVDVLEFQRSYIWESALKEFI